MLPGQSITPESTAEIIQTRRPQHERPSRYSGKPIQWGYVMKSEPAVRTEIADIDEAIARLMTCACLDPCKRAKDLLTLLLWARDRRAMEKALAALLRGVPNGIDADEIAHYAPHWEAVRPVDWSAA